jgi:hypothetical protein
MSRYPDRSGEDLVSGQNLERFLPMASQHLVGQEVAPVQGEDLPDPERLGGGDERGIGEVHRVVRIAIHPIERTLHRLLVHEPDGDATLATEVAQTRRTRASRREHVEGFSENGKGREEGGTEALERRPAPHMLPSAASNSATKGRYRPESPGEFPADRLNAAPTFRRGSDRIAARPEIKLFIDLVRRALG